MNPDPPTKAMPDRTGLLRSLLDGAARDLGRRGPRSYPNAVPGSSDPSRRRRAPHVAADGRVEHMPASGPGSVRRWRDEDGELHRSKKTAGQRAVLVTVET
jgi:hypothetical protein